MEKTEVRIPTADPNITGVIRWKDGGFEMLKEIKSTTGESPSGTGETTETITIIRKTGQLITDF